MTRLWTDVDTGTLPSQLSMCAKRFYQRGWMYGTAGNLSVRLDEKRFLITASGKTKGDLSTTDFVSIELSTGNKLESDDSLPTESMNKPSAETCIHQVIYQLYPQAAACFHIHTVDACLASSPYGKEKHLPLPNLEMIKAFDIWEEMPNISLPLFDNYLNVASISEEIHARFSASKPAIDALMIKNHGVTVWGNTIQQTFNRLEALEFIMSFLAKQTHHY